MQQQALALIVAWTRLDRAFDALNAELRARYGITTLQLSVLRIVAERPSLPLAALRKMLVMHPATLGQAIDALRKKELCTVRTDPRDRRARLVSITPEGASLINMAPLAGPVRLREVAVDSARLTRLTVAFDEAMELFGLGFWDPAPRDTIEDDEER